MSFAARAGSMGEGTQIRWRELGTFLIGAFILLWQTVAEPQPEPWLVIAGLALMGEPGIRAVQSVLQGRMNGR